MTRLPLLALPLLLLGLPAPAHASPWVPPLPAPLEVTRGFDPPETRYGPGHRGVDLAAPAGTVVRAAGSGRVSFAGVLAGRGVVAVVHGDLRTTYEPVAAGVSVGDRVAAGEPIGLLERGHSPCRACLHWGLRRGDSYLDPLSLLRRGPSVLLPLTASDRALARAARLAPLPGSLVGQGARPQASSDPVDRASADGSPPDPPGWSLRSADLPRGATALLSLIAGLVLLTRRPRPEPAGAPDPDDPPVAPALAPGLGLALHARDRLTGSPADQPADQPEVDDPSPDRTDAAAALPVDLAVERARRRPTDRCVAPQPEGASPRRLA